MLEQFCAAVGPVAISIGRKCVGRHLISQNDFDELRAQEMLGSRLHCDHLLGKLKGKGDRGYGDMKEILSTWPSMSSPAVLVKTIQDVEEKVAEGVCI